MPISESPLLKEYMVEGGGLVPGFSLMEEREFWGILATGVQIDFRVGYFRSGDNLTRHIKAVKRKIKKDPQVTVFSVWSAAFRMRSRTRVHQEVYDCMEHQDVHHFHRGDRVNDLLALFKAIAEAYKVNEEREEEEGEEEEAIECIEISSGSGSESSSESERSAKRARANKVAI